uniref:Uncharacterized protein n=1 Tax=Leersia perrieri TaxID=77586 RepID=A0A0D9WYR6_9ORYZ
MSGAPKRLHEEGSHSTPAKRPLDDSSLYSSPSGKLMQSGSSDFHGSFEHDGRFSKVQRTEPRDDKRPSLAHRMPTGSTNFLDHSVSSDGRLESKQNKDARDNKVDAREAKADTRDVYTDSRVEFPGNKVEPDVKTDNRADDNEIRADRRTPANYKGDAKLEKDGHPPANSNITWKDSKEHRGKRNFDQPPDNEDWRFPGLQGTDESPKVAVPAEERSKDVHESTGENKTEPKTEDKFRDKDRKKKDEKSRDFGTRDNDRNDRRIGIQLGGSSGERKESQREDRDAEKWDRERKDSQKDKEGNDREKDSAKEPSVATEKENVVLEKIASDGAVKSSDQENKTIEQKTLKDDSWKSHDRDSKDKKRERDMDAGERHDQRSKYNDKESDETCPEGDIEKDKEALGSVQRRRMVRSRGGKSEVSAIVYKAGECMQELLKSWKEFEATPESKNAETVQNGPTLEIRIPAEFVTSTNRQVKGAQLWGTDIYTNDSDLVAVLMHTGYCSPTSSPPPSAIQELRATVRVLPPQDSYTSTLRNNVRSRAWGAGIGCSFRIERCCIVKKGGGTIDLEPRLSHTSAVEPTLAPVAVERTMTTRAAASYALRQQRFVREVTIQYNLCNEPWLKYSISIVADKGLKKSLYTSARLKKGEVIYLETHYNRYELCFSGEKARSVLQDNLEWEDVQWSQTGVWVAGKEYPLARVHFLSSN